MNKKDASLIMLMLALLAVAGCSRDAPVEPEKVAESPSFNVFDAIYSGSVDEGDVMVELTPVGMIDGKLRVDVGVNTHSVNLEQFDLAKITTLEYNGKSVTPESAPALGGHHSSGTLVFETGEPLSRFRITVEGIPKVDERIFEWG